MPENFPVFAALSGRSGTALLGASFSTLVLFTPMAGRCRRLSCSRLARQFNRPDDDTAVERTVRVCGVGHFAMGFPLAYGKEPAGGDAVGAEERAHMEGAVFGEVLVVVALA